jgi:mannose-1-phosphate guanylyltransferase/mannose-6-phosphate isomerase
MHTLILAGGKGTRLWPLSRELMPKQFIKLFDKSLFQMTVERASLISDPSDIYIVLNREYKFRALDDLSELGIDIPKENILMEPEGKNTLPAIYWGIKEISSRGKCKVAVLPSDHMVNPDREYVDAFRKAEELADDYLITFGIRPTRPHTGYGYIKPGEKLKFGFRVKEFKEKPDLLTAERYIKEGYLWNSGMFLFETNLFMEEVNLLAPEVSDAFRYTVEEAYRRVPEISVDKGIMEKTDKAAVIPLNVYWNDVGGFNSLYDVLSRDEMGNAVKTLGDGEYMQINSSNNIVVTERLTATIGVENLLIVDSGDALLIAKRDDDQKVREIYERLRKRRDERAFSHKTVYRPWGNYTVLGKGNGYKIKRLVVIPGRRLSLQRHYHRSEHWVVVRGTARIIMDQDQRILRPGESIFIPAGVVHRLENPGKIDLEVIEVQIGDYLEEDDIERLEDDYRF